MRTNRFLSTSFQGHLQKVLYNDEYVDEQIIFSLLQKFENLSDSKIAAPPLLYLIDYRTSNYLIITDAIKNISSYDARDFLDGGLAQLLDVYQVDDFKIYNSKVFPANIEFLKHRPIETHDRFIFSYNFRIKDKGGQYISLLQRGSYITSPITGLPLYSLGYVTDITAFKQDNIICHTIDEIEQDSPELIRYRKETNTFYPYEEDQILTKRERDILCYMADGLSSKQIAWKLKISENTIANHRKSMLKKTNTKNVAQLITFACKSRII